MQPPRSLARPRYSAIVHSQRNWAGLEGRFKECISEKNCTLIRFDILESMRNLYAHTPDAALREKALALIETEEDPKYRKKYAGLWRGTP